MKKVLITGVTGQDGSLMADYLLANTDHMLIGGIRRLSVKNHKNIEHLVGNKRFKLIDLDITDSHNTELVIREEQPDYFINFAANSFVGGSWKMPMSHMETNFLAVMYQLEAIRKFAPNCRYYNAGSSEEFGKVQYSPQDEKHPPCPRSPYAASKVAARQLVRVWRESYGLYAVQGWLFNHEGTRRGEEFVTRKITQAVAKFKKSMETAKPIEPLELGNLDAMRDWSDAEDFISGVWMMMNQTEPKDYVLASGETHSVRQFVEYSLRAAEIHDCCWHHPSQNPVDEVLLYEPCDRRIPLVKISPEFYRPAEVDFLLGDSMLARKELGWIPKTSFKELVRKMTFFDMDRLSS